MESAGETADEGGRRNAGVRNVLSIGVPGSINLWGIDLGLVGGDVTEYGGSARGLPKSDNGAEGKSTEGQEFSKQGSGNGY